MLPSLRAALLTLVVVLTLGCAPAALAANAGSIDISFGVTGLQTTFSPHAAQAVGLAVQPDGRILTASTTGVATSASLLLARYSADGAPDTADFGATGTRQLDAGATDFRFENMCSPVLSTAGKIGFCALLGDGTPVVVQLTSAGLFDATFSSDGIAPIAVTNTTFTPNTRPVVAYDSQGRIIYGASIVNDAGDRGSALVRLTLAGVADTTFNSTGAVLISESSSTANRLLDLAVDGDRPVALIERNTLSETTSVLKSYTAAGAPNTAFGAAGSVATNSIFAELTVRGASLYVAGTDSANAGRIDKRMLTTGAYDTSFDVDGQLSDEPGVSFDAVDVDTAGRVLALESSYGVPTLHRYLASGAIDGSFGFEGLETVPTAGAADTFELLAASTSGRMLSFGSTTADQRDTTLVRTIANDTNPPTGTLGFTGGAGRAFQAALGATIWFNNHAAGTVAIAATVTDRETSVADVTLPTIAASGWSNPGNFLVAAPPYQVTYDWAVDAASPGALSASARDTFGNVGAISAPVTADPAAPVGGAISYSAGTTAVGATTITTTAASDAASGVSSAVLTRERADLATAGACATTYAAPVTLGAALPSQADTPSSSGCYRYTLTSTDRVGNAQAVTGGVVRIDHEAPTGGSVAHATGLQASATITLTVAAPTDNSFVTTNVQRRDATYTGGVCAGWSAFANSSPTNAVGSFNETGLTSGRCYEWRLRAVDSVGNESSTSGSGTYVYTLTPPAPVVVGTLAAVGGTGSYHQASPDSTIWFNPTSLGSLTLKVTPFVAETTAHGVTLPTIATSGWAGPAATSVASAPFQLTYAWEAGAAAPGAVTAVARDSQDSATTMTNTIAADGVAPTGVSISYAASNTSDGATSITAALGADAGSGVAGSTLTRQRAELAPGATCGATYAAAVAVGGSLPTLTDTPPTSGCYVYTVTTTDRVGNSQAVSGGIVRIDREAPTGGSLGHVGGIQASSAVLLTLTPPTDISAPAWRVQRRSATYTGGVCGTWSAFTDTGPINPASDFTDTGLTAGTCWEWRLRSVDAVGNEALVASAGTYVYATSPPTVGTVTGSGTGVYQAAPGDTIWFSNRATGSLTLRANPNDPAMAAGGVTLPSITATGWTSPSPLLDASAPFEGAYAWALAAAGPGLVSATLRDGAGNPSTVNATVGLDRDPPAGGAIAYSAASTNAATIALTVTSATDAGSGVASSSITRERADLTAGATCATTWSAPVAVTGLLPTFADTPPTSGCYRYTLTTTDRVGNPAQVVTGGAARLDREAPTGGSVSHVTGLQNSSAVVVTVGAPTDISTPTWRVQRRSADYAGGVCGSWGAFANTGSTLNPTGSFSDTGMLANRCYEWRLRSLDDVGNEAFVAGSGTYVYTLTPPVTPPVGQFIGTVGAGGPGGTVFQSAPRATIWFNATGSGSLALRATTTEAESSANGVTLPTIAASGWANPGAFNVVAPPYEVSYTWATGAASPGTVTATARDSSNTTSSIAGVISADAIPPAGGNIGYSAAPSSVGMTALTVTAPTDAGSGLRSASVTRTRADLAAGATSCGVDSAPVTLQGSAASFTDTPATSGCYVYALSAVDNVGIPRTWSGGTVRIDREAPSGGAISHAVGVMGSSAINIAITTPSDLSGLGWRVQRHEAPYVGGVCGAWSTYADIGSTLNPTGTLNDATMLANRCYEWRLRSVDDVGNEALASGSGTYVYSTTPPAVPPTGSFTGEVGTGGTAGSVYQAAPGATIFFRPNAPAGVLRLRATINVPSDAANGVTFPAIAAGGWSNPIGLNDLSDPFEAQYTWNPGAASPGTIDAKAKNASNVESTVTGVITADGAAPTGALINYPTGLNASGSVTISASGGSDAGSGVATTVIVRQRAELTKDACAATWEAATSVDGELPVVTDTPGASGCYRYAVTSTDRVGNSSTAAYGNPVRIDHEAPAGGAVSHAVGAQASSTVLLTVTAPTDRLDVTWRVQRRSSPFANGVCGGWSAFTDIGALDPASFNNAGLVLGTCYEWRLRSVDAAGNETVAAGSGTYLYQLTPTVVAPTVVTVTVPVPFTVTVPVEVTPLHLVLSAAAYSGRTGRALVVPFAATKATTVVLEVRRGTKVVQRITFKAKAGRNVVKLAKLPVRGTYTLGITSTSGGAVARDSAKLRVLR